MSNPRRSPAAEPHKLDYDLTETGFDLDMPELDIDIGALDLDGIDLDMDMSFLDNELNKLTDIPLPDIGLSDPEEITLKETPAIMF